MTKVEFEKIIKPKGGFFVLINLRELWQYRELFWFLALRDILARYKQTMIGIAWAVIQPILTMIIFTIIFGRLANLPSDGAPYPILTFTALLPWYFFSNSMSSAGQSVLAKSALITKIYFPRLIIPTSAVISGTIDFMISFIILVGLMFWYGIAPTINVIFLPLFLLLAFITALGIGLWISALTVEFRDVNYILPFLVQVGLYISPVAYSSSVIPSKWRLLYSLNPMVGVIDGFRWCILGTVVPHWGGVIISGISVLILFIGGLFYFTRMEKTFADVI